MTKSQDSLFITCNHKIWRTISQKQFEKIILGTEHRIKMDERT